MFKKGSQTDLGTAVGQARPRQAKPGQATTKNDPSQAKPGHNEKRSKPSQAKPGHNEFIFKKGSQTEGRLGSDFRQTLVRLWLDFVQNWVRRAAGEEQN